MEETLLSPIDNYTMPEQETPARRLAEHPADYLSDAELGVRQLSVHPTVPHLAPGSRESASRFRQGGLTENHNTHWPQETRRPTKIIKPQNTQICADKLELLRMPEPPESGQILADIWGRRAAAVNFTVRGRTTP